jgi:phosphoribosylformylglycinamidine (FGAM) synthase-like enzyme
MASRRWVWEQYDTLIQGNSLQRRAAMPASCASMRHATKALAFSSDVTPRYVEADPLRAASRRSPNAGATSPPSGAEPLAVTDNLNFGNPERPEIMGQLVGHRRHRRSLPALGFPIVSGNVSLYNETNGEAILPTPTIGGVGLLPDWSQMAASAAHAGDAVILIGGDGSHLGQSAWLRDCLGRQRRRRAANRRSDGRAPQRRFRPLGHPQRPGHACHDISSGGLALALAEMAMASGHGMEHRPFRWPRTGPCAAVRRGPGALCVTVKSELAQLHCRQCRGRGRPVPRTGHGVVATASPSTGLFGRCLSRHCAPPMNRGSLHSWMHSPPWPPNSQIRRTPECR